MIKMDGIATKDQILGHLRQVLPALRVKYGVEKLALYGSFAKGTQSESSDIDILVELDQPLGFEFLHLADELENTLGRKVDLATFESLQRSASIPYKEQMSEEIKRTLIYA